MNDVCRGGVEQRDLTLTDASKQASRRSCSFSSFARVSSVFRP